MNKIASLTVIIIALATSKLYAQEVGWKLPFLPLEITYSTTEGFGMKGTTSIATPIGQFSISSPTYNISPSSSEQNPNKIIKERVIIEKPVYKDRIVYKEVKGEDKIVKVPVVKEVVKEVIVKENEYLVVLRNKDSNNDMLFIIKGIDELEADIEGRTRITAKEGQIIIDITYANFYQIKFRGKQVSYSKAEPNIDERIPQGRSVHEYGRTTLLRIWTDSPGFAFRIYLDGKYIGNCEPYYHDREPICGQEGTVSRWVSPGNYLVEIFSLSGRKLNERRITINPPGEGCFMLVFSRNRIR